MSFFHPARKVNLLKIRTLFLGVAFVLHLVWFIISALDVSSTDTKQTSSHFNIAIYNLVIQLLSLCAITSILLFDAKHSGSKSNWFAHVISETVIYALVALFQFAGALAYSALSPKFACATSIGATCSPASRAILVGCWAIALLYLFYSIWFIRFVVQTAKRDPTVWSSRCKSFDWEGSGSESIHGHHDKLISPTTTAAGMSPLGEKKGVMMGGGGGIGISTIVMPSLSSSFPPETTAVSPPPPPTATAVASPPSTGRKTSTWMMFPTRMMMMRQGPRPRLESTPHLPIQNLPPPTPFTAVPPPSAGVVSAAAAGPPSISPPLPSANSSLSIPPVPPLPAQFQYQPFQPQQPTPVHLSPIPQDVPEDISLSGTPAALRPVSLAQSLAQKQRQMIMSIKPLRLGLGRSATTTTGGQRSGSIDKTTIGRPKAMEDVQGRRHHSFDDDYSSVAESKYMSMTMTAAEATFNHWWRPESSFAPQQPSPGIGILRRESQQTPRSLPGSHIHLQRTQSASPPPPLSSPQRPFHGRSMSDDEQHRYRLTLEPPPSLNTNYSVNLNNVNNNNNNANNNASNNNSAYLSPNPNPKFLSGNALSVSSRYSTGTTVPPTPPPKDRWRTLDTTTVPPVPSMIPTYVPLPPPPAMIPAPAPTPVPSISASTTTTSIPPYHLPPLPSFTAMPSAAAPAVAVVRPSITRSNTHTTNGTSSSARVANAISERRFMTSPTKGFI